MEKITNFKITRESVYEFVKLQLEDEGVTEEDIIEKATDNFVAYLELDIYEWFNANWRTFDMGINESKIADYPKNNEGD